MTERASGELLDQALCAVHSESYHVRNAALLAIRKYMQHNEEHAFRVCRMVEGMADSTVEAEQMLYNMVKEEVVIAQVISIRYYHAGYPPDGILSNYGYYLILITYYLFPKFFCFPQKRLNFVRANFVLMMETQNVKDTVRQIFTEYLTANGHRKTPERYAILETIYSIDGHFDIDMLYSTDDGSGEFPGEPGDSL